MYREHEGNTEEENNGYVVFNNNYLLTYDSYVPVYNSFYRGELITWASGGEGALDTPGPLNGIDPRSECHLGPGVSRALSPPLTQVINSPL